MDHWRSFSDATAPMVRFLMFTFRLLTDKDGKVSWEEFKKGHFSDDGKDEDAKEQMKEDEEKFKFADEDGDGKLDLEEYMAFYHPGVGGHVI